MDIAPLGFSVDTSGLDAAKKASNDAADQIEKVADATDKLSDKSSEAAKAGKEHADQVAKLGDKAKETAKSFDEAAKKIDDANKKLEENNKLTKEAAKSAEELNNKVKNFQPGPNFGKVDPASEARWQDMLKRYQAGQQVAASAPPLPVPKASAPIASPASIAPTASTGGIRQATQEVNELAHATEGASRGAGVLANVLGFALGGAIGAVVGGGLEFLIDALMALPGQFTHAADEAENLTRAFTQMGEADPHRTIEEIGQAADRAGQPIEMARKQIVDLLESVNRFKTDAAGGTSIFETVMGLGTAGGNPEGASEALQKLPHILDETKVSAAELRSTFGGIPGALETIAAQLNLTKDELIQLAQGGKLTGQQLGDALIAATDRVNDKVKELGPTGAQAGAALQNAWVKAVDAIDERFGASSFFNFLKTSGASVLNAAASTISQAHPIDWLGRQIGATAIGAGSLLLGENPAANMSQYVQDSRLAASGIMGGTFASVIGRYRAEGGGATASGGNGDDAALASAMEQADRYAGAKMRREEARTAVTQFSEAIEIAKKKYKELEDQAASSAIKEATLLTQIAALRKDALSDNPAVVARAMTGLSKLQTDLEKTQKEKKAAEAGADVAKRDITVLGYAREGAVKAGKEPKTHTGTTPFQNLTRQTENMEEALDKGGNLGGYDIYFKALESTRKGGSIQGAIDMEVRQRKVRAELEMGTLGMQTESQRKLASAVEQGGEAFREMQIMVETSQWKLKTFGDTISNTDPIVLRYADRLRDAKAAADELAAAQTRANTAITAAGTAALGAGGYATRLAEFEARMKNEAPGVRDAKRGEFDAQEARRAGEIEARNRLDAERTRQLAEAANDPRRLYELRRQFQIDDIRRDTKPGADQNRAVDSANAKADADREKAIKDRTAEQQRYLQQLGDEMKLTTAIGDEERVQRKLIEERRFLEAQGLTEDDERYQTAMKITEELERQTIALEKQVERARAVKDALIGLTKGVGTALSDAFHAGFTGAESMGKAFLHSLADTATRVLDQVFERLVANPLVNALQSVIGKTLPGLFGKGSGGGGDIFDFSGFGDFGGGGTTFGGGPGGMTMTASGSAWNGGRMLAYMGGGVFSHPTRFQTDQGQGLMGEAGPEAVMPLARGSNGRLGVVANGAGGGSGVEVKIIDQRGANAEAIQVKERQRGDGRRQLEIMVRDTNKRAIRNGEYDNELGGQYGLSRSIKRV